MTAPFRPYAHLSLSQLCDLARAATSPAAIAQGALPPALPRLPADLLREVAAAAGVATAYSPEE